MIICKDYGDYMLKKQIEMCKDYYDYKWGLHLFGKDYAGYM